jgi:hypothetical protein
VSIPRFACALLAAAVLLQPASAFAQQVGVKAGINFASLPPEEDEHPDIPPRLGPIGGVWVQLASGGRFTFQAEGLYSEKGVHWNFSPDVKIEIRIRYVEFPLLARTSFGGAAAKTRVFVVGGLAPAFKLSVRANGEFFGRESTRDAGEDIEPFDLGLLGGVGVEFGHAQLEARYTHGLLGINTDDNEPNDRLNNRVFSLTIGFRIR